MNMQERKDMLLLYVAGALDEAETRQVRAWIASGDPAVIGALAEAEATFHAVPAGLPEADLPADGWQRIAARIDTAKAAGAPAANTPYAFPWRRLIVPAAAVLLIAFGIFTIQLRNQLATTQKQLATLTAEVQRLQNERTTLLAAVQQDRKEFDLKLASLSVADRYAIAGGEMKNVKGALFYHRGEQHWTVFATGIEKLPPDRTLELWVITEKGTKIAVGSCLPDAEGKAFWELKLPPTDSPVAIAAITDEPHGGVTVPTGKVQFLAMAK